MDAGQKHTQSMQPNGARVGADPRTAALGCSAVYAHKHATNMDTLPSMGAPPSSSS